MDERSQGEYVEAVLSLVEDVPPGRVTTYGALAETIGRGGPRQVGRVMSTYGGSVPWWRVVHADGRPAYDGDPEVLEHQRDEGTPLRPSGRVDLARAMWWPPAPPAPPGVSGPGASEPDDGITG